MNAQLLQDAWQAVEPHLAGTAPTCCITLGSGWGSLLDHVPATHEIPYSDIPHLGTTGVKGHAGRLLLVDWNGTSVMVFQGRRHYYEGAGWEPVAIPIYLTLQLRIPVLLLTNAAGGIRSDLAAGDLMILDDHLNLIGSNPLIGAHDSTWGPRFPDQSHVYDPALRTALDHAGTAAGVTLKHGTYGAASGPTYETPAEIAAYRSLGADAIGMSTVPEAILASAAGIKVAGLSCITNVAGSADQDISHDDVVAAGTRALPIMQGVLSRFIQDL